MMIIALIVGIIVFYIVYFFVSIANSNEKLLKLYNKYMAIRNEKGMLGKDVAFLGRRVYGLDIRIAMRDGVLTDAYSVSKKIVIMSNDVCNSASIASAGIVAHELGHAVQHKNRTFLFGLNRFLNTFSRVFCGFAVPCCMVGGVMWAVGWYANIGQVVLIVGIALFIIHIMNNLIEIPLESNASEIGFRFLIDYYIIDKKDYRKVKKLMRVAGKTYMKDFFKQLIPFRFR